MAKITMSIEYDKTDDPSYHRDVSISVGVSNDETIYEFNRTYLLFLKAMTFPTDEIAKQLDTEFEV